MQGVYYQSQRDDHEPCVKIEIMTGPSDTKTTSGVCIGGGCLMNRTHGNTNIGVGGGVSRASTSTTSRNNVTMGDSCCEAHSGDNFPTTQILGIKPVAIQQQQRTSQTTLRSGPIVCAVRCSRILRVLALKQATCREGERYTAARYV